MEKKIDRYELLEEIGRGGVGIVYKARDSKLNRIVAIKLLEKKNISKEEIKRFVREAKIIAGFKHPNIVTIHDIVSEQEHIFFSMDLVEGDTLEKLVTVKGKFTEKESLSIILKVAKVLQVVHAKEIVHRDIKPSNIMITPDRTIKILDFGTAKLEGDESLTCTGAFVGTLAFAAPEQFNHAKYVTIRSDIYNLGSTLFYLLTGEPPYKGGAMEIMYQHCFAPVPSLEGMVSESTNGLLQKMMAKKPEDRFENPAKLIQAIQQCQGKETGQLPLWCYYMVSSGAIDSVLMRQLTYVVPETGAIILDMASPQWKGLSHEVQLKYSKLYQKSYAKAFGFEIEKTFYSGGANFAMRFIPPGRFLMGPSSGEATSGELPQAAVVIADPFWLGKYPVTQKQWKTVTGQTPWRGQIDGMSGSDCAAAFISWSDIHQFFLPKVGKDYFVPTEAQWEYACRSGSTTSYFWGNEADKIALYAWYAENAYQKRECYAHVVGKKKGNPWGLFDMLGNIWEKCADYYAKEMPQKSMVTKTKSLSKRIEKKTDSFFVDLQRIERGGAWDTFASNCRCAKRSFSKPENRDGTAGFRIAKAVHSNS